MTLHTLVQRSHSQQLPLVNAKFGDILVWFHILCCPLLDHCSRVKVEHLRNKNGDLGDQFNQLIHFTMTDISQQTSYWQTSGRLPWQVWYKSDDFSRLKSFVSCIWCKPNNRMESAWQRIETTSKSGCRSGCLIRTRICLCVFTTA